MVKTAARPKTRQPQPVPLSVEERLERLVEACKNLKERILLDAVVDPAVIPDGRAWYRWCLALHETTTGEKVGRPGKGS